MDYWRLSGSRRFGLLRLCCCGSSCGCLSGSSLFYSLLSCSCSLFCGQPGSLSSCSFLCSFLCSFSSSSLFSSYSSSFSSSCLFCGNSCCLSGSCFFCCNPSSFCCSSFSSNSGSLSSSCFFCCNSCCLGSSSFGSSSLSSSSLGSSSFGSSSFGSSSFGSSSFSSSSFGSSGFSSTSVLFFGSNGFLSSNSFGFLLCICCCFNCSIFCHNSCVPQEGWCGVPEQGVVQGDGTDGEDGGSDEQVDVELLLVAGVHPRPRLRRHREVVDAWALPVLKRLPPARRRAERPHGSCSVEKPVGRCLQRHLCSLSCRSESSNKSL